MLLKSIRHSLDELLGLLDQVSAQEYSKSCDTLSNATIGENIQQIIERFQCLENGYDSGILNYSNRERNNQIQTETEFAKHCIAEIKTGLKSENRVLYLEQVISGLAIRIQSSYYRELLYNLEHCVHHQALIKVAVLQFENKAADENSGVAHSTIEYRKQCVQ
ncbi:DinB family protein [Flavobacterium sp. FlaQc-48]|uniref:DinB family protein n=1 Tax=Flavobacterium sp. FlaQc-48 TaxID=3374181 RepID=UPI00375771F5